MTATLIHICISPSVTIDGREWELAWYGGPWPLKKNGEPLSVNTALRLPKSQWAKASEEWRKKYEKRMANLKPLFSRKEPT